MRPFLVAALLCGFGDAVASAQWQLQAIKSDADFRGLCAVGPTVAWVSGTKGTFGRTADGGKTWTAGTVADAEKLDFQAGADSAGAFSIAFRDRNHGVIVGGDYLKPDSMEATGAVTTDGGKTWTLHQGAAAVPVRHLLGERSVGGRWHLRLRRFGGRRRQLEESGPREVQQRFVQRNRRWLGRRPEGPDRKVRQSRQVVGSRPLLSLLRCPPTSARSRL